MIAGKSYDECFDAELGLIQETFKNPGYHSRLATGTIVHPTRTSLDYAIDLLLRADPACDARAFAILDKIISLQDQDPVNPTYGIWSWNYEEPLEKMDPPDWNWADFCGFRIARALLAAGARFPDDLRHRAREALRHAAGSIYRRNIGPHYTNISIMGGVVTAVAGELLNEPRMLAYGRRRLARAAEHHRHQGGFNEYNSPTYTRVVITDCAEGLECVHDPEARSHIDYLFRAAWKTAADHFHPATGQWAGPHSRDYHVFQPTEFADYVSLKTGVSVTAHPAAPEPGFRPRSAYRADGARCPEDLRARFAALPAPELELRERFIRRATDDASAWGTTWLHTEACLGSVNRDFIWDQRRVLLGYWNGDDGNAVALRLRFLRDGREFASAYVLNNQRGPSVLSAVHFLLGRGEFHPVWGAPKDDVFTAEDLRLRYELIGTGAAAEHIPAERAYRLRAGSWGATLAPAPGCSFDGAPVRWEISRAADSIGVDAVCYSGPRRDFPFRSLRATLLGAGLHLHPLASSAPLSPPEVAHNRDAGLISLRWASLELSDIPDHAIHFPDKE